MFFWRDDSSVASDPLADYYASAGFRPFHIVVLPLCGEKMGYQQKLLYVSGLLVVSIAILLGIQNFQSSMDEANLDALKLDLLSMAVKAQGYFHKPKCLEGGGHSFMGITANAAGFEKLLVDQENLNGIFSIVRVEEDELIIQAVGKNDTDGDGQNLTVQMIVYPDSVQSSVISY